MTVGLRLPGGPRRSGGVAVHLSDGWGRLSQKELPIGQLVRRVYLAGCKPKDQ
jgi:hypothetical protein